MKHPKEVFYANRGVKRTQRPLKNIVYDVEVLQLKPDTDPTIYEKYKYKEEGYLMLFWHYEEKDPIRNMHGFVTPENLKERIGLEQWKKFGEGKRTFIIQRRINGKNI